ncbi:MAG TPA: glycosyl hydrolase [Gemmatimonadaceae bacterium]|nr:glycosyl hydrolase [Gemmatimonadaceae bacterium]
MRQTPSPCGASAGALAAALLLPTVLAPRLARAQTTVMSPVAVDSMLFRGMEWRSIGPNRGGRSIAVAGSASRPLEYYFGATGGGLWKTTDGGQSWRPVTDGQLQSSSVGAVAVAPSNPDVVYIGMGETEFRGNIMQGDGVYRSADAGKTWTHVGLAETQAIAKIRIDPHNPDVVYVAAFGHPYGRNVERGIFKSTDGGKSWRKVLYRDDRTAAIDIAMDPSNPNVLYGALWEAFRTPWSMSSGGPGSGLFKSTDAGETWTELTRNPGLPRGVIGKIGISVSPVNPRRVYAIVEAADGGVFRSDDAGATWKLTNGDRKLRQRAFYYTHITADPTLADRVYVLNVSFFRSDDAGAHFDSTVNVPHGDNHDLWIAPNDNQRMIEANDGGGTVSVNAGKSWTAQNFPTAQLYHVATTTDFPYHVCGAQQDNSTLCLPSRDWENLRGARSDALGDWMYDVGGGESGYIAPDPRNPNIFYAGSQGALLTRYDRSNGQVRDVQVYPRFFSGEPASALPERWQWTYPIVFSPRDPRILYTSSQHLFRTVNEGQSWERISPDLTRADTATLGVSGGPITHDMNGPEIYATIFTIAPSPLDVNVIWTGSDDGLAYVTRDGGRSWTNVTPPTLPKFARISLIEASPHAMGTAYLAAKNYQNDDRAPYLYRTHDFGRTWTKIVSGIRADDFAQAVREDPRRARLLYAGTEHGIYVSWDDGDHWQSLSRNLPDVQVSDLVVEDNDLVIATHGRSMYTMDDIAPIRAYTPAVAAAPLTLYAPATATRGVEQATIQYTLTRAADSVTIDILDGAGKVVRTYTGGGARDDSAAANDSAAAPDSAGRSPAQERAVAAERGIAPGDTILNPTGCESRAGRRRRGGATHPSGREGLNRFTWDLRYPGASTFPCLILWGGSAEQGPEAVPGAYRVRVTANGQTATRPLTVRMDPRLKGVSVADVRRQFDLAMRIRDRVSAADDAVIRIRRLRSAIAARAAQSSSPDVQAAGARLAARLSAVEQELYQVRNRSGQDPLNFPIRLNNRLAALQRSVETGDARPTDAAYVVFRQLSADLDATLERLEGLMATDVKAFNQLLATRSLRVISER